MQCRSLLAGLVAVVVLGCSSKEFEGGEDEPSGGRAGGGMGGTAPTGGSAGDAGMPSGGGAGMAGSAGAGGMGGMPCSCPPTQYCHEGECLPCAELSMLDFGEPELMLDHPSASIRFPRVAHTPDSLFYRAGNEGAGQIWYTPSANQLGMLVGDSSANQQSGALFVGAIDPRFNLIFDQTLAGERNVRASSWDGNAIGPDIDMPSPLSAGGYEDYSPAAAIDTARLYWMSTRGGQVALHTGVIGTGEYPVVTIDVPKRTGMGTCAPGGNDVTPWVTPDGRRMFFRALPMGDDCQPVESTSTDLFVVPLEPMSGIPTAEALALSGVNEVGSTETDPSLSPDFCTLYFASDKDSPGASDFRLYRARRR